MTKRSLIVDLTCEQMTSYLLDGDISFKSEFLYLKVPLRAVVLLESGKLKILTGEAAEIFQSDEESLCFYNLVEDLPELEDNTYVQQELTKEFWSAICFTASKRYEKQFDSETTGFIVYPQNYSSKLLEAMRSGCYRSKTIKDVAFISEAAALTFGIVQSDLLKISSPDQSAGKPVSAPFAVILGYNKKHFEVVCFDYKRVNKQAPRLLIRDYFQSTSKHLDARLEKCEWKTRADVRLFLEATGFEDFDKEEFKNRLQRIMPQLLFEKRNERETFNHLKLCGASYIAKYSMAEAEDLEEIELINSTNIGIRIDQGNFYPVLQKDVFNEETKYPCFSAETFDLSGIVGKEFTFSVHAGYSELIRESVVLGYLSVNATDLSRLTGNNKSELIAIVCLNMPGEGEFTLGLMPDNRIIGKLPFVLPAMVC